MMEQKEERMWASICHLSSLLWIPLTVIGFVIPFINIVAPALVWYFQRKESEFIDAHGKESLNFQISMTLYGLIAFIIFAILLFIGILVFLFLGNIEENPLAIFVATLTGIGFFIGILLFSAIAIFQLAVVIFAAVKAKDGQMYRYPFNLRLL